MGAGRGPEAGAFGQRPHQRGGQPAHVARAHQQPRLAVPHDLRHPADIGRHGRTARQPRLDQHPRHALGAAARHDHVGRGQRVGRAGEHPGEVRPLPEGRGRPDLERRPLGPVARDQQVGALHRRHRVDGVGHPLLGRQRADRGHDRHAGRQAEAGAGRRPRRRVRDRAAVGGDPVGEDVQPSVGDPVEIVDGVGGRRPQGGDRRHATEQHPRAQAAQRPAGPRPRVADAAVHDRDPPAGQGQGAGGQRARAVGDHRRGARRPPAERPERGRSQARRAERRHVQRVAGAGRQGGDLGGHASGAEGGGEVDRERLGPPALGGRDHVQHRVRRRRVPAVAPGLIPVVLCHRHLPPDASPHPFSSAVGAAPAEGAACRGPVGSPHTARSSEAHASTVLSWAAGRPDRCPRGPATPRAGTTVRRASVPPPHGDRGTDEHRKPRRLRPPETRPVRSRLVGYRAAGAGRRRRELGRERVVRRAVLRLAGRRDPAVSSSDDRTRAGVHGVA